MKAKNYKFRAPPQIPPSLKALAATARACRRRVVRRAWLSAATAALPVPGLGIALDVGNISRMLQEINEAFGLTPEAIEALAPHPRFSVHKVIATLGNSLVGRVMTHQGVQHIMRLCIRHLTSKKIARSVPLAGPLIAATLAYAAVRLIGMQHIQDCAAVARASRTTEKMRTTQSDGNRRGFIHPD